MHIASINTASGALGCLVGKHTVTLWIYAQRDAPSTLLCTLRAQYQRLCTLCAVVPDLAPLRKLSGDPVEGPKEEYKVTRVLPESAGLTGSMENTKCSVLPRGLRTTNKVRHDQPDKSSVSL